MSPLDGTDAPSFESSPTIGALAGALAKAQSAMTAAPKDALGKIGREGGRTYGYASLASVWSAVRAPLAAHELAVIQTTEPAGPDGVCVVTTLAHASGEWVRGRLYMPVRQGVDREGRPLPHDAQGFGSALTYARRYALSAITGIAPDDDDGSAAVQPPQPAAAAAAPASGPRLASPRPAAPPAEAPAGAMTPLEVIARDTFGPKLAAATTHEELRTLRAAASNAGGGRRSSPAYQAWFREAVRQAEAGIGPAPASPGPAKARPQLATSHGKAVSS